MFRFLFTLFLTTTLVFGGLVLMNWREEIATNVIGAEETRSEAEGPAPLSPPQTLESLSKGDELFALGQIYLEQEQFEAARELFNTLPADQTSTSYTSTLYYQGTLAAFFGDTTAAETLLNQVITRNDDPALSKKSTNLLSSLNEYKLAEEGSPAYLKTLLARSMAENEEISMAIALVYEVLRDEPDYRDAWIILGYSYLTQDKFKEAQEALFKAVQLDPVKAESRYFLGLSYFGLDDYGSAVTQLELAIKGGFEPKVQAYQKLGDAAVLAQNYPTAADAYEKILALNSTDVGLYVRPIWLYLDQLNNPKRALELGSEALKNHPDSAMAYNLLGWAQIGNKQYAEAEQNLNSALVLDVNLAAAHLNFGRLFEQKNDPERAKESYKRAYTLDPDSSVGQLAATEYNRLMEIEQKIE